MNTHSVAILNRAREIIANPDNWTQHAMSRTDYGAAVEADHKRAHSFCSIGAIRRASLDVTGDMFSLDAVFAERALHSAMAPYAIMYANDVAYTHQQVLDAFDRAVLYV